MKYSDFEEIISTPRMSRYLEACNNDTRKAMTLYRYNHKLSQELLTVISLFEVALRNIINKHYIVLLGEDWLRNSASVDGIFDSTSCYLSKNTINLAITKLNQTYTHNKLVAELGFGFWRFLLLDISIEWQEVRC